jgi:hypothetical protein
MSAKIGVMVWNDISNRIHHDAKRRLLLLLISGAGDELLLRSAMLCRVEIQIFVV